MGKGWLQTLTSNVWSEEKKKKRKTNNPVTVLLTFYKFTDRVEIQETSVVKQDPPS